MIHGTFTPSSPIRPGNPHALRGPGDLAKMHSLVCWIWGEAHEPAFLMNSQVIPELGFMDHTHFHKKETYVFMYFYTSREKNS